MIDKLLIYSLLIDYFQLVKDVLLRKIVFSISKLLDSRLNSPK